MALIPLKWLEKAFNSVFYGIIIENLQLNHKNQPGKYSEISLKAISKNKNIKKAISVVVSLYLVKSYEKHTSESDQ
jgi:hypothetical protein